MAEYNKGALKETDVEVSESGDIEVLDRLKLFYMKTT